jgi:crotonobetainyl-CoA:carnitine CoA-transferase CaiB-like acyl-CoA transferase
VLELGQLLAGPFCATLLAYFGAEVIKVEPPGAGDAIRGWRLLDESGTSLWWYSLGRNKKSVTLDLRQEEGRALARRLADRADVLVENFRPGTLERWGLGPEELRRTNPRLVCARISGYGQTGPYSARPGYASVCEGVGGLRFVNGHPGEPPVRANLSLGDSLGGLHAALGVLLALYHRDRDRDRDRGAEPGRGQDVDTALYESVFNLLEGVVPEYDRLGVVRQPSGTTITGIVPTNTYPCADGKHVIIGGNGESIYRRLMTAAGRADLAADARLQTNAGRVAHQQEVDHAIAAWTATLPSADVLATLEQAEVPAGPILSVADMFEDPHFRDRGLFEQVEAGGRPLAVPAILPKLSETPGATEWAGPAVGAHTEEVLRDVLGLGVEEVAALRAKGVV